MVHFSRITGAVVLIAFSWTTVSCGFPEEPTQPDSPVKVVITPGEGTPCYLNVDAQGKASEEDTGRTGFFIEDNKNAEGVVLIADTTGGEEDIVSLHNPHNKSTAFIYYKKGAYFPNRIVIEGSNETYTLWLSQYRDATQSYDVMLQRDGKFESQNNFVLAREVLSLYHNDSNLSDGQNQRLRLINNSLGVWGSIAATFKANIPEEFLKTESRAMLGSFWSDLCRGVSVFLRRLP